jgi:hypothetical protein
MLFQQAYSHRKQVLQMNFLVGSLVLSGGERVVIVWSDGRRTEAVYQDTFGYTHVFLPQGEGREIRLSNRFMRQKGIRILPADERQGEP